MADERERVICLVDMDCFYVQVEQRKDPSLKGKPCAVVQYQTWKGGGIIAVSYEARSFGVTRQMRGDEAQEKCPDIRLVRVPEARGKANLTHYREACAEVIAVLSRFSDICEKASVDEAYLDITEHVKRELESLTTDALVEKTLKTTFIEGYMEENKVDTERWRTALETDEATRRLAVGAILLTKVREAVLKETGFACSAGVAHNKVLAKLACGLHKPNQQTLLPQAAVPVLFSTIPIQKVRSMGGKLGTEVRAQLGVEMMGDVAKFSLRELQARLGDKTGEFLHQLSRGVDFEPVRPRQLSKSIGCGKNFPGKAQLSTQQLVTYWLRQLSEELDERLKCEFDLNKRQAKLLTVSFCTEHSAMQSRSCPLRRLDVEQIVGDLLHLLLPFNCSKDATGDTWSPAFTNLSISASRFNEADAVSSTPEISSFFAAKNKDGDENQSRVGTPSRPSQASSADASKPTANPYEGCVIDASVLDALPSHIQREIQQSLGEGKDKASKKPEGGIRRFFSSASNDKSVGKSSKHSSVRRSSKVEDFFVRAGKRKRTSSDSREERSANPDFVECDQCHEFISQWEMPEHLDFHFAKSLQYRDSEPHSNCQPGPGSSKPDEPNRGFLDPSGDSSKSGSSGI